MRLDRALIKSQAKQIIKGQIFGLFLISMVVGLVTGGVNYGISLVFDNQQIKNVYDRIAGNSNNDIDYFEDFNDDGTKAPDIDYFNFFNGSANLLSTPTFKTGYITNLQSNFGGLISFLLTPLTITLCGLYVMIIRGNKMKTGEYFKYVFSNTFNETYLKKLLLYILKTIVLVVMFCLFIVPGVIFHYRYYFAEMIMNDNPSMSPKEALKLSTEMTRGHKTELFSLDVSFIGWFLLVPFTFGLISIYILPYVSTTQALYYENFRMRCIEEQANPEQRFMTEQERNERFVQDLDDIFANAEVVKTDEQEEKDSFGSGMDNNYYNGNF